MVDAAVSGFAFVFLLLLFNRFVWSNVTLPRLKKTSLGNESMNRVTQKKGKGALYKVISILSLQTSDKRQRGPCAAVAFVWNVIAPSLR